MTRYQILAVLVMALFTYLPRFLPLTFFRKKITSKFINSALYYLPYAVLGALTFPGVFNSTPNLVESCAGIIVAVFCGCCSHISILYCAVCDLKSC